MQVALISQESKVFAKGRTDGSSHQLFISIISCMLRSQIMEKLLLPMEFLPLLGKKMGIGSQGKDICGMVTPQISELSVVLGRRTWSRVII